MDSTHVVEISKKEIVIQELKDQIKAMDARAKRGNLEKEKMISISEDEKDQIIIQKKWWRCNKEKWTNSQLKKRTRRLKTWPQTNM